MDKKTLEIAQNSLSLHQEHMAPMYTVLNEQLNQRLAGLSLESSVVAIEQAHANKNLITDIIKVLPRANEDGVFAVETPAELRWLQHTVIYTVEVNALLQKATQGHPYYIVGSIENGRHVDLLLADAVNDGSSLLQVSMNRKRYLAQDESTKPGFDKPIPKEEINKYYDNNSGNLIMGRDLSGEILRKIYVKKETEYSFSRSFSGEDESDPSFLLAIGTVATAGALQAYHALKLPRALMCDKIVSDLPDGIWDSELEKYDVFQAINILALAFEKQEQISSILASYASAAPETYTL